MKAKKDINIQIGERIRYSRETAGYTQEKLADQIGVTVQYISDLERGVVGASTATLIKICNSLNVSGDYILMGMTEKTDISDTVRRLEYLDEAQMEIINRGINLMIEALNHQ